MDKFSARFLFLSLVLVFCFCSQAVHFLMESISLTKSPATFEISGNAGQPEDTHEHSQDNIVVSFCNSFSFGIILVAIILLVGVFFFLAAILPQLPPPKHFATA
jgi:hypothetical protein